MQDWEIIPGRKLVALFGGGGAATAATVLGLFAQAAFENPGGMASSFIAAPIVGLFAFIVWTAGIVFIAGPAWALLHRLGFRSPVVAAATGLVLASLVRAAIGLTTDISGADGWISTSHGVSQIVFAGRRTLEGWGYLFANAFPLGVAGAVGGLALWRIAYRKRQPDAQVFS